MRIKKLLAIGRPLLIVLMMSLTVAAAVGAVVYNRLPDYRNAVEERRISIGTAVLDRNNQLLRVFPDDKERCTLWRDIDGFPQCLKQAAIAAEDKRFFYHWGFDPIAIARALCINLSRGWTVSGASTITQQVVRLITPRPRTYRSKIIELVCAVKMESQLTKSQILELYLNLSPMGGNIRGAALAALRYFDKDVASINVAEAAVIAAVPRSPTRYNPRGPRGRKFLLEEKDRILQRMADLGWISPSTLRIMVGDSVRFRLKSLPINAPHFVDFVRERVPAAGPVIRTTLDLQLQRSLEQILGSHRLRLAGMGVEQAGVLVVSSSGDILGMIGSMGYGRKDEGFNNAVIAARSAGSTLKPFLYGLALEKGFDPASEIPDTMRTYQTPQGDYLPVNADRRPYGPVSVRSALGNSLNISAVKAARDVGLKDFCNLLEQLELPVEGSCSPELFGLGLAIGNLEVSLYRLVQAYEALCREGEFIHIRHVPGPTTDGVRVFSRETAYAISHILSDHAARVLTFGNPICFDFGFPVAVKTGTSTNFRDCWTVGYTTKHVVGIWAGNFSGRPNNGYPGSAVCGPILGDIVRALYGDRPPAWFRRPEGVREELICSMSGKAASANCPQKTMELFLGSTPMEKCNLPHADRFSHYLTGSYAQWIDRREAIMGKGRFRLMSPDAGVTGRPDAPLVFEGSGNSRTAPRIEIVSPHDSDRFVMSPHQRNVVVFRAVPTPVVSHVTWLVDGVEIGKTPPPYEITWQLTRGSHSIHAVTPAQEAARVTIHVE